MTVRIGSIEVGARQPMLIIAGPCVIESWETIYNTARALKDLSVELGFSYVFKASFDKANRTSFDSFRGPGLQKGLEMLQDIKKQLNLPVLSDIHEESQCAAAGEVLDILQIPALSLPADRSGGGGSQNRQSRQHKEGQFVAPLDILHSVRKVTESGNPNVLVTERGTTFGYNNLVVDFRSIPMIQSAGYPLIFDATHSVQLPSAAGGVYSGQRQYIPELSKAAVAAGCQGLFMEVHPNPDEAKSDAATQIPLSHARDLLTQLLKIHRLVQEFPAINLPEKGKCGQPVLAQ